MLGRLKLIYAILDIFYLLLVLTRHTHLRNVHGRDTSKMESFQCHLCARLANTLRRNSTYSSARFSYSTIVFIIDPTHKCAYLFLGQAFNFVSQFQVTSVFGLYIGDFLRDFFDKCAVVVKQIEF